MSRQAYSSILADSIGPGAGELPDAFVDSAVAWAGHVDRLLSERDATSESLPAGWGAHDYIAACLIRDRVEKLMPTVPESLTAGIARFIKLYDVKIISFTEDDYNRLLARFAIIGSEIASDEIVESKWWWHRIPKSGPAREELLSWSHRT
jgi:hypothetical protein